MEKIIYSDKDFFATKYVSFGRVTIVLFCTHTGEKLKLVTFKESTVEEENKMLELLKPKP